MVNALRLSQEQAPANLQEAARRASHNRHASDSIPSSSRLQDSYVNGIPDSHRAGLKRPLISEQEAADELVSPFPAVHLELYPAAERLVVDITFSINFLTLAPREL
jgi:hypothetical protein